MGNEPVPEAFQTQCARARACAREVGSFQEVSQVSVQRQSCPVLRALHPGLPCPRPRCQLPAPAICCGRCLAVPWQRQNRMCLWIEAGTSPRSQAAHAVPFPKGLLQRTAGVQVAGRAMFISGERQSPGPLPSEASGAGAGGDVYAQRVGVLLPLLQAAWVCFPPPFREMLRQCVGVGGAAHQQGLICGWV